MSMETLNGISRIVSKFYDPKKKRVVLIPLRLFTELKPKIVELHIGKNSTKLKMTPEWFKYEDQNEPLKNIVYPKGISENEQRTYNSLARYRAAIDKPNNNFRQTLMNLDEKNTETLIIALDDFVQQFGGELTFTNEEILFENSADDTACGVANLSSAHLLTNDYIPTAKFSFLVDLDYQSDLARSSETMQKFILEFSKSIAQVLGCPQDYVRVISLDKPGRTRRQTKINFGITTPDPTETEQFVQNLKVSFLILSTFSYHEDLLFS
jgi:hypothetical protein